MELRNTCWIMGLKRNNKKMDRRMGGIEILAHKQEPEESVRILYLIISFYFQQTLKVK